MKTRKSILALLILVNRDRMFQRDFGSRTLPNPAKRRVIAFKMSILLLSIRMLRLITS